MNSIHSSFIIFVLVLIAVLTYGFYVIQSPEHEGMKMIFSVFGDSK